MEEVDEVLEQLEPAAAGLNKMVADPRFVRIKNSPEAHGVFTTAADLAMRWNGRVMSCSGYVDVDDVMPLVIFMEQLAAIIEGRGVNTGETDKDAITRVTSQFKAELPMLVYEVLDADGITRFSEDDFPSKRIAALNAIDVRAKETILQIDADVSKGRETLAKIGREVEQQVDRARISATKLSIDSAQTQFKDAARTLRLKAGIWTALSMAFLGVLVWRLLHYSWYPPMLIQQIVDSLKPGASKDALPVSVPLLIAASTYFTSIRLALVGVLGVGLAYSLRMMGAYFQMLEHNSHKLRVTNSIEAFVAAVRTPEQRDLILGKLVESVTEFGESGILGSKGAETKGIPSVLFETVTKNIGGGGKSE